tara:strand:- start:342 stop:494 length:153 start_codon:yes stop_codon:yes gene_type:complete
MKIKHKITQEVKECSELDHYMMMDSDDWEKVVEAKKKSKPKKSKKFKKSK